MDERFTAILDSLPPKEPRSRLEPYRELIREMRRRGRTYREIAQVLAERCQLRVAPSTVHEFVSRRSRSKSAPPMEAAAPSPIRDSLEEDAPPRRSPPVAANPDVQQRIQALKQRPGPASGNSKPVFAYDETEPLRVRPTPTDKASDA